MLGAIASAGVHAEMSAEELAKLSQSPVGNLISAPFQNNTNLNYASEKGTQNILNIQPVIPIEISKDWNIIQRTHSAVSQLQPSGRHVIDVEPGHHGQLESERQQSVDRADRRRDRPHLPFRQLPMNTQISAYYNVARPDISANWQVRAQVQFMFPK